MLMCHSFAAHFQLNCCHGDILLQEFDRQSSLSVQKLFDELELILFERSAVGSVHLRNECSVWKSVFPHLRYCPLLVTWLLNYLCSCLLLLCSYTYALVFLLLI